MADRVDDNQVDSRGDANGHASSRVYKGSLARRFPRSSRVNHKSQPADMDLNVTHRAFIAPYYGRAMNTFYKYLEHNNRKFAHGSDSGSSTYCGKFCSIVLGSGTGKSRLLFEGAVVLYMNLRPSDDLTGFPERDDVPADILTQPAVDYNTRCCSFFTAVFVAVRERLSAASNLEDALKA